MNRAVEIYSRIPKTHNCAQAVAAGCGREDLLEPLKANGGGRSPEGRCGALHVALLLSPAERHAAIKATFREQAGSEFCKEIRSMGKTPCARCVEIGAELATPK
ncbi:MAG: hypothetical protein FWG50_00320 [Kiritimatiellaeota bacterium]|nr:hypothetical protein [Kiritimatiellota bacterium]